MARTASLPLSATTTIPSLAMADGAFQPPCGTIVVTLSEAMTRMALLPRSATRIAPVSSTAMAAGSLSSAVIAQPSTRPGCPVPAIVVTLPPEIAQMR